MRHTKLPKSLGDRLRAAALLPALTVHRSGLWGLAAAVDRQAGRTPPDPATVPPAGSAHGDVCGPVPEANAEAWAQLDLFTLFGRPETYRAPGPSAREARVRTVLGLLPSLLVFLPLVVTWYGLSRATHAYQELRSTGEGRRIADGRTFLDLWQDGFGGHLSGAFTFGAQVWWTIASLGLLIVATLAAGLTRRGLEGAAERDAQEAAARLQPLLTETQLHLLPLRLETPARFAAELSGAAARLTTLLEAANRTHSESRRVADTTAALLRTAQQDIEKLSSAAAALDTAAARLDGSGDRMAATTERTIVAAEAMGRLVKEDIERARTELADAAGATADDIRRASEVSAQRITALGDEAVRTVAALSDAATQRMTDIGGQVEKALELAAQQGGRLVGNASAQAGASLTRLLDEVRVAAAALDRSSTRLGAAGGGLSEWLEYTLGEGADRIARTYELAIATAAVELSRRFHEAGGGVESALAGLTEAVGRLEGTVGALRRPAGAAVHDHGPGGDAGHPSPAPGRHALPRQEPPADAVPAGPADRPPPGDVLVADGEEPPPPGGTVLLRRPHGHAAQDGGSDGAA
ncbi:hypothetical protein ACFWVC_33395 [Streptomyces sp. NPDC058691]|uniref:hypothetical protein n=1 Tax=Streptomyces sp. NPDC058691 TaxID=3346601 RepID=UPI003668C058